MHFLFCLSTRPKIHCGEWLKENNVKHTSMNNTLLGFLQSRAKLYMAASCDEAESPHWADQRCYYARKFGRKQLHVSHYLLHLPWQSGTSKLLLFPRILPKHCWPDRIHLELMVLNVINNWSVFTQNYLLLLLTLHWIHVSNVRPTLNHDAYLNQLAIGHANVLSFHIMGEALNKSKHT